MGFEPTDQISPVNSLAVSPIRPLSHLSIIGISTKGNLSIFGIFSLVHNSLPHPKPIAELYNLSDFIRRQDAGEIIPSIG